MMSREVQSALRTAVPLGRQASSPAAEGESLFDFLLSPFFYYCNQVLLQFLSNELALSCDDFVFYFHRSLCSSGTLSLILNCVTADSATFVYFWHSN